MAVYAALINFPSSENNTSFSPVSGIELQETRKMLIKIINRNLMFIAIIFIKSIKKSR